MPKGRIGRIAFASCLIVGLSNASQATPLTYVSILTGTGFADQISTTAQDITAGSGESIANFNDNGIAATGDLSSVISAWLDTWSIFGGTGTGTTTIYWSLDGTLTGCSNCTTFVAPSVTLSSLYGQFVTSQGTPIVTDPTLGLATLTGSFDITFTYGVPFSEGLRLSGSTGDSAVGVGFPVNSFSPASFNFLNTATITSIVLPAGASLQTASGTEYPLAAPPVPEPVPEPASLTLTALGLAGVLSRYRRRGFPK